MLHEVLDDLAIGIMIVAGDLRVLDANASARATLERRDGLWMESGRLRLADEAQHEELATALPELAQGRAIVDPLALVVPRDGSVPLYLRARPLRRATIPSVGLYVIDDVEFAPDEQLLRRLYGLSRAEQRVAAHLMRGATADVIAERLFVSPHTVRTHIKNLFAKTHTTRQAELVRLLNFVSSSLRDRSRDYWARTRKRGR